MQENKHMHDILARKCEAEGSFGVLAKIGDNTKGKGIPLQALTGP
jgi:hypothetical protein